LNGIERNEEGVQEFVLRCGRECVLSRHSRARASGGAEKNRSFLLDILSD
jgi:hypothetical protein